MVELQGLAMQLLLLKGLSEATFVDTLVNSVAVMTSLNDRTLNDLVLPGMVGVVVVAGGCRSLLFERIAAP